MFPQANNVVITGGCFTDIQVESNRDPVLSILLPHVATGAIFDSAERYPPGRCHPGTRQRMINRITNWIEDANPVQRILWLYGPAGAGKSALMQSICELLRDSDPGMNVGSFFFAKGHMDRSRGTKLFVTLSYQLAVQIPSVREELTNALDHDPTLPTKSLDIQLRSLIIDPLLCCQDFPPKIPTLFIDGLDECDSDQGVDTQCEIITLISNSILEHKIPIRFMIASRPEYWIRDTFRASPVSAITLPLTLQDDTDADKDIRSYLTENFEKICREKSRIMQSVPLPWPPTHIVDQLVHDASGQYIYASTILKFIGKHSPFCDPQEQLRIVTTPGPHRATALSGLDRLYSTILSVYPRWETMKRVLGGLLVNVSLTGIQVVLGVPKTEITLVMDALSSLVDVASQGPSSEGDQPISFYHLSFREFLLDETRSGLYHIDIDDTLTEFISMFFSMIRRNLEENYETEPHTFCDLTHSEYGTMMKTICNHVSFCHYEFHDLIPVFHVMAKALRRSNPCIHNMNNPECFRQDMTLLRCILVDVYTSGVAKHAFPSFLRLTKRLEILVLVARDIHRHSFLFGTKHDSVVWVVWVWWRAEYLCLRIYVWVWYGVWRILGWTAPCPAFVYLFSRCMLLSLALDRLRPERSWYRPDSLLQWCAWACRYIYSSLDFFLCWMGTWWMLTLIFESCVYGQDLRRLYYMASISPTDEIESLRLFLKQQMNQPIHRDESNYFGEPEP